MDNSNNFSAKSDKNILQLFGNYIREQRIRQNKTQQQLSSDAGINRTTLVQFENGGGGTLGTFVQLLRALDCLYVLKEFELAPLVSPLQIAKLQIQTRKRVRNKGSQSDDPSKSDW